MMYFKGSGRFLLAFALFLFGTNALLAAGTTSGTDVTNSVTLDYEVGSIAQTQLSTSITFEVDRVLSVVVTTQDGDVVAVSPGQSDAILSFDVTNTSNADIDLLLGVVDQNATAVTGFTNEGPTAFDGTGLIVALDTNANGTYESGVDTDLTAVGNHFSLPTASISPDVAVRIFIVASIPLSASNTDQATYSLVAAAASGTSVIQGDTNNHTSPGGAGATDVVDDTSVVQDVFGDNVSTDTEDGTYDFVGDASSATQDSDSNGQHSDSSAFVIASASLTLEKLVQIIWDPINGYHFNADNSDVLSGNNPKAIPGSILMYVVAVQNGSGADDATDVTIVDDLSEDLTEGISTTTEGVADILKPDNVTFGTIGVVDIPDAADESQLTIVDCGGTVSNAAYDAAPEVTQNIGTCSADETGIIVYFVTVN